MKYRRFGRTGIDISEIGFGGWGIGGTSWIGAEDQTSLLALKEARDHGINLFDSALVYGEGRSERLIAQAFGSSSEIVVATKIPPKNRQWPMPNGVPLGDAFPREHVEQCLIRSLRNLRRESIDLLQYHVWSDEWADNPEWLETVLWLRRSGVVRWIGISVNDHQSANVLRALRTGLIDSVQVIYNIFEQSPEDRLFEHCMQHDIGVLARTPFDEGGLTGNIGPNSTFPENDFRNGYFAGNRKVEVWKRIVALVRDVDIEIQDLPKLALQFCLSHKAVTSVIPGMRTWQHVRSNAAVTDRSALPQAVLARLKKHRWTKNFYSSRSNLTTRILPALLRLRESQRNRALNR
jgi:aryl-alcohol dehydrogenase-like predicted oxidoreductase